MELSVIIPTRNRRLLLEKTIQSVYNQTLNQDRYEVIVVDNGSSDSTDKMVHFFMEKYPNLRYFHEAAPGLHNARHKGLKESSGELLTYIDDDIEAFPSWLTSVKKAFENPQVVLVGGKNLPKFEISPPKWILRMWNNINPEGKTLGYLSILDLGDKAKVIDPNYIYGCNFSIRKKILIEARGFHPDGMPESMVQYRGDGESHVSSYVKEKNYIAYYHPGASVYHFVPKERMTSAYFIKRAFNQGISHSYALMRKQYFSDNYLNIKKQPGTRKDIIKEYVGYEAIKAILLQKYFEYRLKRSHYKGFRFHRRMVQADSDLLEFVIQPTYLEV